MYECGGKLMRNGVFNSSHLTAEDEGRMSEDAAEKAP